MSCYFTPEETHLRSKHDYEPENPCVVCRDEEGDETGVCRECQDAAARVSRYFELLNAVVVVKKGPGSERELPERAA